MQAKFELIREYGFAGGGYWNVTRQFNQGFILESAIIDTTVPY
jgi:spore germination protein YaaH